MIYLVRLSKERSGEELKISGSREPDYEMIEMIMNDYENFFAGFILNSHVTLHLESRSVMCNGAEEKQAHSCDPYGLRVQEQPLFLVCSSINIFTSMGLDP